MSTLRNEGRVDWLVGVAGKVAQVRECHVRSPCSGREREERLQGGQWTQGWSRGQVRCLGPQSLHWEGGHRSESHEKGVELEVGCHHIYLSDRWLCSQAEGCKGTRCGVG